MISPLNSESIYHSEVGEQERQRPIFLIIDLSIVIISASRRELNSRERHEHNFFHLFRISFFKWRVRKGRERWGKDLRSNEEDP